MAETGGTKRLEEKLQATLHSTGSWRCCPTSRNRRRLGDYGMDRELNFSLLSPRLSMCLQKGASCLGIWNSFPVTGGLRKQSLPGMVSLGFVPLLGQSSETVFLLPKERQTSGDSGALLGRQVDGQLC